MCKASLTQTRAALRSTKLGGGDGGACSCSVAGNTQSAQMINFKAVDRFKRHSEGKQMKRKTNKKLENKPEGPCGAIVQMVFSRMEAEAIKL